MSSLLAIGLVLPTVILMVVSVSFVPFPVLVVVGVVNIAVAFGFYRAIYPSLPRLQTLLQQIISPLTDSSDLAIKIMDDRGQTILIAGDASLLSDPSVLITTTSFTYKKTLYQILFARTPIQAYPIDSVLNAVPGIAALLTPDLNYVQINQQFAQLFHLDQKSAIGKSIHDHPELESLALSLSRFVDSDKQRIDREVSVDTQGQTRNFLITASRDEGQQDITLVGIDITRLRQTEEKWRKQSSTDPLTGLANRIQFNADLAVALERAEEGHNRLAILFFDLDRFRIVNDSLGHIIGDLLLQAVAELVKGELIDHYPDAVIARWGGDEFTILLPSIGSSDRAIQTSQRLLSRLDRDFWIAGYNLRTSASIGIAIYPEDGEDNETLIKNADAALHFAKSRGRNNWQVYSRSMNSHSHEVLILENSLHRAIAHEEFAIYYQPKVNAVSNKVTGLEALIRWHHPELGLVMPNDFVPLAEDNGMVVPIGEWVLREVCRQNRLWSTVGLPMVPIAVNLSARQFLQPNLLDMVDRALKQAGVPPNFLEIEITESLAMNDVEMTRSILKRFYQMGIGVTIDDFGTGYSSLNSLKQFPVHTLKIDKSFVREIATNHQDRAIVQAIIALSEGLKLNVIGEGVETIEQLEVLRTLKCREIQGFLFSRPLPAQEMTRLLRDTGARLVPRP